LIEDQSLKSPEDIKESLTRAEMRLTEITNKNANTDTLKPFGDVLLEVNDDFLKNYENGSGITGVPSGFPDLDRVTSGFQKQDLIILAARPSMGKSSLALNIAMNMAIVQKKKVVFFNLEMSRKQMAYRLIGSYGNIDISKLRSGKLNTEEYERYTMTIANLSASIDR